jgi:septal ring factor EnvC (AmiA/AmiB activator)
VDCIETWVSAFAGMVGLRLGEYPYYPPMRARIPLSLVILAALGATAHGQAPAIDRGRLEQAQRDSRSDAAAVRRDIETLQAQLVQLAAVQATGERGAGDKRARLQMLKTRETAMTARLGRNRNALARLLGALELYRRDPPPALLVHPSSAKDAVRAAILVRAMAPELERRGRALGAEAAQIARVRREVAGASEDLFQADSDIADRRAHIEGLVLKKANLERNLLNDAAIADQALAALAAGSGSVAELVQRLPAQARMDLQAPPTTGLPAPVQGVVVARYGQRAGGGRSSGWTYRAPAGALVRAPAAGLVEYAGPLKGWGIVLILRVGGGYHLVLTGLEAAQAVAGSSVAAGEPVGRMAGGGRGGDRIAPELYVEVRKDGAPVDPAPWFGTAAAKPADAG